MAIWASIFLFVFYLKQNCVPTIPVNFSKKQVNLEKSQEGHMNVNYNFLTKLYSELTADQKLKFNKSLQISSVGISKTG